MDLLTYYLKCFSPITSALINANNGYSLLVVELFLIAQGVGTIARTAGAADQT